VIDFVVDGKRDPEKRRVYLGARAEGRRLGPGRPKATLPGPFTQPPGVWARYAHLLLETNEFASWMKGDVNERSDRILNRRQMLTRCGMGMARLRSPPCSAAQAGWRRRPVGDAAGPLTPKKSPLPAKAKRIVHLFMNGGAPTWIRIRSQAGASEVLPEADPDHAKDRAAYRRGLPVAISPSRSSGRAAPRSVKSFPTSGAALMIYASFARCTPTSRITSHR